MHASQDLCTRTTILSSSLTTLRPRLIILPPPLPCIVLLHVDLHFICGSSTTLLLPYVILARLQAAETIRQSHPTVQMTLLHHRRLCPPLDFLCSGFFFSLLINIFHSITATCLTFFVNLYILLPLPSSLSFALVSHYTTSSFTKHLQDVLPRRRKILGLPVPLLQAQRRYVRCIWHARPSNTREDRPRRLRLRETLNAPSTSRLRFTGWIFGFWVWNSKSRVA